MFEVIAGVAGLLILLALLRCAYSWRKTPSHDRVAAFVNRHELQREMEQLEREDLQRRLPNALFIPPPPPYQHAPAYDCVETPPMAYHEASRSVRAVSVCDSEGHHPT